MPSVNPEVLVWARETAGLSQARAAKSLALGGKRISGEEVLARYEAGSAELSRALLEKMAAVYRRPLLTFYLPAPPAKATRGEDFRTLPDHLKQENAGALDALVRDIYVRQDLIKHLLQDIEEAVPCEFVGTWSMDRSVAEAATHLQNLLKFDLTEFRKRKKPEDAFAYLRTLAEDIGAFVLLIGNLGSHHSNLPVEVFRGFAVSDKIAPLIVINDQDAPAARSFTLLHEMTHILLGASGVSGARSEHAIERYCNDVASHLLLRPDELAATNWPIHNLDALVTAVSAFGRSINISGSLVAYRLHVAGTISDRIWTEVSERLRELWIRQKALEKSNKDDASGPSYYVVKRHKVGNALVSLVHRTLLDGAITATKAGKVLGVKPANVYNLVGI